MIWNDSHHSFGMHEWDVLADFADLTESEWNFLFHDHWLMFICGGEPYPID
jgi:hypothetical protein